MRTSPAEAGRPFDLSDPQTLFVAREQGRLADLYRQLANESPLWRLPGVPDVYLACTRDLVEQAVAQPEVFSSNLTRLLYRDGSGNPALYEMAGLDDPSHVLATADPPSHTLQRRLLHPVLARRAIQDWDSRIRRVADALLDAWTPPRADIATGLADPLTMRVVCQFLGIPDHDTPQLVDAVIAMDRLICGLADRTAMDTGALAALNLGTCLSDYLTTTPPPGSILATLSSAITTGALTEQDAIGILLQLVTAGTETTATLIGHAVHQLTENPELQRQLRERPADIPDFLEDVLRDDGPFQFHSRTTREGAVLGGTSLPAGSLILLMWASANQHTTSSPVLTSSVDPPTAVTSTSHLAFGRGIHFCIGAHLARLEARITIEQLLRKTSQLSPDPDRPAVSRPSLMMSRPSAVPIHWQPA